jgi:hypothetical protein
LQLNLQKNYNADGRITCDILWALLKSFNAYGSLDAKQSLKRERVAAVTQVIIGRLSDPVYCASTDSGYVF